MKNLMLHDIPRLAYTISRHPESIEALHDEGRLATISGVGETIAEIIGEFIETGTCTKLEEFAEHTPKTVLELTGASRGRHQDRKGVVR